MFPHGRHNHGRGSRRMGPLAWIAALGAILVLALAHGFVLQYALSHLAASAGAVAAMAVALLLVKHLGWLGLLLAWLRRRGS